ncbi:hypothetical protein LTR36_001806 [Oleoguttula mirabilis]|uniref:CID domain-containing protein n=1 Tax=Oleoguttula mirabilis TaxID=1507867 RepID=A0AAV9JNK2_9PEZI|nr:hypothetical protein LTR36_001806 [Oleoguttula mirabilis]
MADPFEVRMRFTSQLQHLNASTTSALKAAHYALKYADFSDDLHSCILEQLERNNMNNRANIMYFLPSLCDTAKDKGDVGIGYVRMVERDILRIVDAVAPDDGSGAANVKVVRKVLGQLQQKQFLQPQTVLELEEFIGGRDSVNGMASSPGHHHASAAGAATGQHGGSGGDVTQSVTRSTPAHATARDQQQPLYHPGTRLDKRQIEQRIEEDRERHKRAREGIWAISQESSSLREDGEYERMCEEVSDGDDDDFVLSTEETEERCTGLEYEETLARVIACA